MDLSNLKDLTPDKVRGLLPAFLSSYIIDSETNQRANQEISKLVASWDDADIQTLVLSLHTLGDKQQLYSANPHARALSRVWARSLMQEVQVHGIEHLKAATDQGPTVILCNHASYMDSSVIDALVASSGHPELAARIISAAGPKVYSTLFRRFAALCLNTLPVPQSTSLGHTARLSPRELARMALKSVKQAHECLQQGHTLLIFPEGSRTRTGRLQPFLQAVYRYLALDGLQVVPTALIGCREIMDLDTEHCVPGPVSLTFGAPLVVHQRADATKVYEAAADALSQLLPQEMRPE